MKFNRLLDNDARVELAPVIEEMWSLAPEMMRRKISEANVQQAFVLAAVRSLACLDDCILVVGAHEDTAWQSLVQSGYSCINAIDPEWNGTDLDVYHRQCQKGSFDLIVATSVIEHVPDDGDFVQKIGELLVPGGYAILTMDFCHDWTPELPKPIEDYRLYTAADMLRLLGRMPGCQTIDPPSWHEGQMDFSYGGCSYAFATLVVRKETA